VFRVVCVCLCVCVGRLWRVCLCRALFRARRLCLPALCGREVGLYVFVSGGGSLCCHLAGGCGEGEWGESFRKGGDVLEWSTLPPLFLGGGKGREEIVCVRVRCVRVLCVRALCGVCVCVVCVGVCVWCVCVRLCLWCVVLACGACVCVVCVPCSVAVFSINL